MSSAGSLDPVTDWAEGASYKAKGKREEAAGVSHAGHAHAKKSAAQKSGAHKSTAQKSGAHKSGAHKSDVIDGIFGSSGAGVSLDSLS